MRNYYRNHHCFHDVIFVTKEMSEAQKQKERTESLQTLNKVRTCMETKKRTEKFLKHGVVPIIFGNDGWGYHQNVIIIPENSQNILHVEPHGKWEDELAEFLHPILQQVFPERIVINPAERCGLGQGRTPYCKLFSEIGTFELLKNPNLRNKSLKSQVQDLTANASRLSCFVELVTEKQVNRRVNIQLCKDRSGRHYEKRKEKFANVIAYYENITGGQDDPPTTLSQEEKSIVRNLIENTTRRFNHRATRGSP